MNQSLAASRLQDKIKNQRKAQLGQLLERAETTDDQAAFDKPRPKSAAASTPSSPFSAKPDPGLKTKSAPKPKPTPKTKTLPPTKIKTKPVPKTKPAARPKAKPAKRPKKKRGGTPWPIVLLFWVGVAFLLNAGYQVVHKPTEIVGVFDSKFHKTPSETWAAYGGVFQEKATKIMTSDLLAALAQAESNGNPIVRTYWQWRWNSDVTKIFAPASSAVGMFQITEGTFSEAKHYCVRNGEPRRDGDGDNGEACFGGSSHSRLIPAHAVEMTAARLHLLTERILSRSWHHRRYALRDKQEVAIIAHLCGPGKAERLVKSDLRLSILGKCGDHSPATYVSHIRRLQSAFRELSAAAPPNLQAMD